MNDQVSEIKSKTDIVSVIGERIELKKAGRNYKANCPFHGEKTPSFMVSPELQIFKCFGCSESGDVFSFLEKFEGMEFSEALKYLADKAGVKLIKTGFGPASEKEKLINITSKALKFYNYMLLSHALGKKALEYLTKERGLDIDTIKEFQLGYSPENSYIINDFLIKKEKFSPQDIDKAGIGVSRGGSNFYDRFNGRVIFPLFDHRGNPIGFAGRVLPWDKRDTGKYINSPETPIYHKSSVLFGLNITRANIKKKKVAIVVEGELDLISSYQAGIKNVVAIKGSAITEGQVRLLSRFAPKFILALDSDFAGDAASRRGITIAENMGVEVRVAKITNSKDPDEAARKNLESYKKDLIGAQGVWDFLIDSVFSRFDSKTGAGKSKISKEIIPVLSEIEDKIVQAHYANVLAKKLGVPLDAVIEQISKIGSGKPVQSVSESPGLKIAESKEIGRKELLETRFLSLVLHSDPKSFLIEANIVLISDPLNKRIAEEFLKYPKKDAFEPSEFADFLPKELLEGFTKLMISDDFDSDSTDELKKELDLVVKELKILGVKDKLKQLTQKISEFEKNGDKIKLLKAQNKFNKIAGSLAKFEFDGTSSVIFDDE